MQVTVVLVAAIVVMALEDVASARECEADHQCENSFCYQATGLCTPCTDCGNYLRQAPQWRLCAHNPQDCGNCLPGYEFDILTDGSKRDFCVPVKYSDNAYSYGNYQYIWIIVAVMIVASIIAVAFILVKYCSVMRRKGTQNSCDTEDPPPSSDMIGNPPPSYDSSVPLLISEAGVSSAVVSSLVVTEKEGSSLQQAVPFTSAHPPYGSGDPSQIQAEPHDEAGDYQFQHDQAEMFQPSSPYLEAGDEDDVRVPSPPQLETEDTMPSEWVPSGVCYAQPVQTAIPSPSTHTDQSVPSALSSATSSLSDISHEEGATDTHSSARALHDSGVSATGSHQSDVFWPPQTEIVQFLPFGQISVDANRNVLERRHSDENISGLCEFQANKRRRCDSGSASMKSLNTQ